MASSHEARRRLERQSRTDTDPEMRIRRALHARGYRYRVHRRVLANSRRTMDIVFPAARLVVLVDGCFWHACAKHATWPKANAAWWRAKIEQNRERDRDTDRRLQRAGWQVLRIWEHEDVDQAVQRVERMLLGPRPSTARAVDPSE